jgi:DNA repair exonuclease SbcCD ATPase subunit
MSKIIAEIELRGLDKFNNELSASVKAADKLEQGFKESSNKMTDSLDSVITSTKSLSTQMRENKAELTQVILEMNRLKDSGDKGSDTLKKLEARFNEVSQRAGRLDGAMKDASKTIANTGSDTRGLDRMIRTLTLGGISFQIIEGSAALFGVESENLQRTLVRLNAVMAITNALQQIQDELTKEDTVATKGLIFVKTLYARAVGFAAAQTKIFQLALAGLGIGLLIAAVATLAANWDRVKKALGFATDEQERNNKALEVANKLRQIQEERFNKEIELRRLRGEDEKKLVKEELQRAQDKLNELKKNIQKEISINAELAKFKLEQVKKLGASQQEINKLQENSNKKLAKSSSIDAVIDQEIVVQKLKNQLAELNKTQDKGSIATANLNKTKDKGSIATANLNKELKKATSIGLTLLREQLESAKKSLDGVIDKEVQLGSNLVQNKNIEKARQVLSTLEQKIKDIEDALNAVGREAQTTQGLQEEVDVTIKVDEAASQKEIEESLDRIKKDIDSRTEEASKKGNAEGAGLFTIKVFGIKRSDYQSEADYRVSVTQKAFQSIADISAKITSTIAQFNTNTAEEESQKYEGLRSRGLISEKNYQRQLAKIKNDQAKKQRKAELAQAAVNIPIAILSAFTNTQGGIVVKAIAASIAGTFAGAQLAAIAKKPIPQFFKGTKKAPSGFKWVGEKGPELLHDKGGYSIIPNKESEQIANIYNKFDVPYKKLPKPSDGSNRASNDEIDRIAKILERSSYRQIKALKDKGVIVANVEEIAQALQGKKYV